MGWFARVLVTVGVVLGAAAFVNASSTVHHGTLDCGSVVSPRDPGGFGDVAQVWNGMNCDSARDEKRSDVWTFGLLAAFFGVVGLVGPAVFRVAEQKLDAEEPRHPGEGDGAQTVL